MSQDDLFGTVQAAVDHRCLGCGQVHAGAREVALVDGTLVSSYSDAWRTECEARGVLNLPGLARRQARLEHIERVRGKPAAEQLRNAMLAVWNARMKQKLSA